MKTLFILGLTGSIGTGKSTMSRLFRELDIPVWDADAAVHRLYQRGGAAVNGVASLFPEAVVNEEVDRSSLSRFVLGNEEAMKKLEAVVHPLVFADRRRFLEECAIGSRSLVVVDIPMLFETKGEADVDAVLVLTVAPNVLTQRVMGRAGMTLDKLQKILARQIPSEEKCRRADFVIDTTPSSLEETRAQVKALLESLRGREGHAFHRITQRAFL